MIAKIHQMKNDLSRYLEKVARGEEVVISRYNVPVARIVPFGEPRRKNKTRLGRSRNLGRITGEVTGPFLEESDWSMLDRKRP